MKHDFDRMPGQNTRFLRLHAAHVDRSLPSLESISNDQHHFFLMIIMDILRAFEFGALIIRTNSFLKKKC